ncbi:hypothetical protein Bca4012_030149 [Brassica carinata]|uniref:Uncharacterized protein n=1 Tax=Brassica carinata TaxID=52824 RepID=A0A8X7UQY2_BRACI|nr:hypothetical protein Bca52824_048489 [Brassica carinata]
MKLKTLLASRENFTSNLQKLLLESERRAGGEKMYNVFHNQFLVALKRLQVDKQELVHKSANETVMVSTYTRIKAIPIGHIRLINGDNLDTQTPMTSKTLGGVFVYLKIPTLFASVIFSSKALRTANLRWVETLLWLSQIRLLQCMSSEKTFPHHKILELVMRKVLVPVDLSYLEVKKQSACSEEMILKSEKLLREREVSSRGDIIKLDLEPYESFRGKGEGPKPSEDYK